MTAFSPEPHTLLTVYAAMVSGSPAISAACRAGFWPTPACTTLPDDDLVDLLGPDVGPLQRLGDGDGPELRGRHVGQPAEELADRRADGGEEEGVHDGTSGGGRCETVSPTLHVYGPRGTLRRRPIRSVETADVMPPRSSPPTV